jgi:hypothetical protein
MSATTSIPILSLDKQLAGDSNWGTFQDTIMNLLRGKGLDAYPKGLVQRTAAATFPGLYGNQATAVNSRTPSIEEYELRDNIAAAIIYQNIVDPQAHGLSATGTSREIWAALHAKFNCSSEVLKGAAKTKLMSVKLLKGVDLPTHLQTLTKLRDDANRIGCHIQDEEMISIILQSLPPREFGQSIMTLRP